MRFIQRRRAETSVLRAGLAALLLSAATAMAGPVADALDRAATPSTLGAKSVMLGIAQAGQRWVAVGERGLIILSDDGGRRWRAASVPVSVTLTAVRFASERKGFAIGHGGTVLTTDDGGDHWVRRLDGRRVAQIVVAASKASGDGQVIAEAERLVADGPDKPLLDLLVSSEDDAMVVGAYGLALVTTDGGETWHAWMNRLDNPRGMHLYAIRRSGQRILVAGEQGLLRLSRDGGQTFSAIHSPYDGSFFSAELPPRDGIVAAGLRGNVWRSEDHGTTWRQLVAPVPASVTGSLLKPDGTLVLVNQAGMVLGERDSTLVPLTQKRMPPLTAVAVLGEKELLTLSVQGPVRIESGDLK